jgi:hypothetical protein
MATVNFTKLLGLALPTTGDLSGTWGSEVNNYVSTYLDSSIAGAVTVTADTTLTKTTGSSLGSTSSQYAIIIASPASANITITAPAASKAYIINNTSGTYTVKIVGAGPTTGVTLLASEKAIVAWNGSDFVKVASTSASTINAGTLGVSNGGTGLTTTPANGALDIGNGTGFTRTTLTQGTGVTITNGSGTITIAATGTGGTVTSVTGSGNIASSGGTTPNITFTGTLAVANGGTGVTSSTGSGNVVLSTSPTLTTPVLGTPTSGTLSSCTVDGTDSVGFRNIPQNSQSASYTLVLSDSGKHIFHPSTDANARTYTIPANSSVAYPIGTAITFINMTSQVVTIAITTDTMYLSSAGTTGSRSLAQYGSATAIKMTSTTWLISGSGLT